MSAFNPNAKTPEEHLANVRFQLENVEGWLSVDTANGRMSAAIKAECLLDAATQLHAAFAAEQTGGAQ